MTTPPRQSLSHAAQAFLVGLVDTLGADFESVEFLSTFVARSVVLLEFSSAALLLPDSHGVLEVAAHSQEPARNLSHIEIASGEGPCIDAHRTGLACWYSVDPALAERWPDLADAARRAHITTVLVVPMRHRREVIGVLTLLGDRHTRPGADTLQLAQSLAEAATIGLLNLRTLRQHEQTATHLQAALTSRVLIEQAKGILAERLGVGVGEAFALLRGHARAHNRNLHTVAQEIIDGQVQITKH